MVVFLVIHILPLLVHILVEWMRDQQYMESIRG